MVMWIKILGIALICVYFAFNILTAKVMTAKRMKHEFIEGQCLIGKIFANLFYAPAWILKGCRALALAVIA